MLPTFVTGFGPFGEFFDNPSSVLAAELGRSFQILPVSYLEVEAFFESFPSADYGRLVMLGVSGLSSKIQLEWRAQNKVGTRPDVDGSSWESNSVFPDGPSELTGSLWAALTSDQTDTNVEISFDAGDYLCNFAYYLARIRYPLLPSGFIHVPPFEAMPKEVQLLSIRALIEDLERADSI